MTIRKLHSQDFDVLDTFLTCFAETSMFMRSNVRKAGFELTPETLYSADYYGYFEGKKLQGILAFCWNGMILTQVPNIKHLTKFVDFINDRLSTFALKGLLGPTNQVVHILTSLIDERIICEDQIKINSQETTYGLLLHDLIIPSALAKGDISCRPISQKDISTLIPWSIAYHQEAFHVTMDETKIYKETLSFIESQTAFVLEVGGKIVSRADFNATLPDIVQIGGVWTPPEYRNQGYARAIVAGALLEAKRRDIDRATLFTKNPSAARAYKSLGFVPNGTYHILLLNTDAPN